jgi:hypothetical protein
MYVYWPIECTPKSSFVGVFELARIKCMSICQLNAFKELQLWGCLNSSARIRCMFIGQLNALQNLHLWGCFSLQELNVCLFANWMHLRNFNCGGVWIQVQELDVCLLANWLHSKIPFARVFKFGKINCASTGQSNCWR